MRIKIYSKPDCPFCHRTKEFFQRRNISYDEKIVGDDITPEKFNRDYQTTVPAIFIDEKLIGGYDQLMVLYTVAPEFIEKYE